MKSDNEVLGKQLPQESTGRKGAKHIANFCDLTKASFKDLAERKIKYEPIPDIPSSIIFRFDIPQDILDELFDTKKTVGENKEEVEIKLNLATDLTSRQNKESKSPTVNEKEGKHKFGAYNIFNKQCQLSSMPDTKEYHAYISKHIKDFFVLDKMQESMKDEVLGLIEHYLVEFQKKISEDPIYDVKQFTRIFLETFTYILGEMITHFTGLSYFLYFDQFMNLNLELYASKDELLEKWAEQHSYALQLKITSEQVLAGDDVEPSQSKPDWSHDNEIQFEDLNEENIAHFPPHVKFTQNRAKHFRKYLPNSRYHDCGSRAVSNVKKESSKEPLVQKNNCMNCSIFRTIDRVRLIKAQLDTLLSLNELQRNYFVKGLIIIRNNAEYEKDFEENHYFRNYFNILESSGVKQTNHFIRNYLGEKIGYYFLFASHYITWLIYPSLIGILIYFLTLGLASFLESKAPLLTAPEAAVVNSSQPVHKAPKTVGNLKTYLNFIYTLLIIMWGCLYTRSLGSMQRFYRYVWGMSESNEASKECPKTRPARYYLFQGIRIPVQNRCLHIFKMLFTILISILMMGLTIAINLLLQYFADIQVYGSQNSSTILDKLQNPLDEPQEQRKNEVKSQLWYFLIPIMSVIVRTILSAINYNVVDWACRFEDHVLQEQYDNSYMVKVTVFEFVNYYFYLIFVAYFKKHHGMCAQNDCFGELGHQLILVLLTSSIIRIAKILFQLLIQLLKSWALHESIRQELDHRITSQNRDPYNDAITFEYLEVLFNYGYIILFGISSPICFLIAMLHTYIKRFVDLYRIVKLSSTTYIESSQGVGIVMNIMKIFTFLGIITNCTIIYFTMETASLNKGRWAFLFAVENAIVFLYLSIKVDTLPSWFAYLDKIKYSIASKLANEKAQSKSE